MDKARQRFKHNVELLTAHDPALAVMGDRDWTNACENPYIQYMAKKLWLFDYRPDEVVQLAKAVTGYLKVLERRRLAQPVEPGNRIIKGEIASVRLSCPHDDESCIQHWFMSVRDMDHHNMIYTPIPRKVLEECEAKDLVGQYTSYYAYITVSERDNTFGFAHRPKLMAITKEN